MLVSKIEGEPNNFIYIFNEFDGSKGFWSHCYLDAYVNNFHKGIYYHNNNNYGIPATKEQRGLLFSKMKEAGYEWDVEKKELKKIEQKPIWSEEDERICQCLIEDQEEALDKVNNSKVGHSEIISDLKEMYRERIAWLKSLQQRMKEE